MTLLSFLLYLIPISIGILIVHLVWNEIEAKVFLVKATIGIGLGIGLTSMLYFLFVHRPWFLELLLGIGLALVILTVYKWSPIQFSTERAKLTRLQTILLVILAAVLALDAVTFIGTSLRRPNGNWDSWAIWNRDSRFIYRGGDQWQRAFSSDLDQFFHPDYPPLFPMTTAWVWDVLKTETLRTPMVHSGIFLLASGMLIFGSLLATRSLGTATLGAITLMGLSGAVTISSNQFTDLHLSFFILATAVLFAFYDRYQKHEILALAGVTTGLAAWTKNEGLAFVIPSLVALAVICFKYRSFWRPALYYLGGALIPLAIVAYFKIALAPQNDIMASASSDFLPKIMDLTRYPPILMGFASELIFYGPLLLPYYFFMRGDKTPLAPGFLAIGIFMVIQACFYFAAYLLTPYDVAWHVKYSLPRILVQIYPAGIFLLFSITQTPESVFSSDAQAH